MSVSVRAMGMASPLGRTAAGACAAARAGISRIGPADGLKVDDPELGEVPVAGHVASHVTRGFEGVGRLARLAAAALRDLLDGTDWRPRPGEVCPTYLALPGGYLAGYYYGSAVDDLGLGLARPEVEATLEQQRRVDLQETLVPTVARMCGIRASDFPTTHVFHGTVGLISALSGAIDLISRGDAERCLVGAVDSWVDPVALQLLFELGMLQIPGEAGGVIPGEAAAFFLLEDPARSTAQPLGFVRAAYVDASGARRFDDRQPDGRAEAGVILACTAGTEAEGTPFWTLCDMTGDGWRAQEWGNALTLLPPALNAAPGWYTGTSFGEAGAANAAVGLCMALQTMRRRAATPPNAVLSMAGYDGLRGAALVSTTA